MPLFHQAVQREMQKSCWVFGKPLVANDEEIKHLLIFNSRRKSFIVRARVLKLYRQALRITARAPADSRAELRHMIRTEMDNNRNCGDKQRIKFLISEGKERLKRLDEMLDMQGH